MTIEVENKYKATVTLEDGTTVRIISSENKISVFPDQSTSKDIVVYPKANNLIFLSFELATNIKPFGDTWSSSNAALDRK